LSQTLLEELSPGPWLGSRSLLLKVGKQTGGEGGKGRRGEKRGSRLALVWAPNG